MGVIQTQCERKRIKEQGKSNQTNPVSLHHNHTVFQIKREINAHKNLILSNVNYYVSCQVLCEIYFGGNEKATAPTRCDPTPSLSGEHAERSLHHRATGNFFYAAVVIEFSSPKYIQHKK